MLQNNFKQVTCNSKVYCVKIVLLFKPHILIPLMKFIILFQQTEFYFFTFVIILKFVKNREF